MGKESRSSLESIVVAAIGDDSLASLTKDYLELGVDALLSEGVLREIPLVSTFVNIYGATQNIQSKLLFKKIVRFLDNLGDVPPKTRQQQIEKLIEDPKEREAVGENILLILDNLSHISKPEMLARAFRAFLEERIDREDFYALAHVIEAINPSAIPELTRDSHGYAINPGGKSHSYREHLMACGLFSIQFSEIQTGGAAVAGPTRRVRTPGGRMHLNQLGKLFISIVLLSSPGNPS